jgi:hypothetical protein
LVTASISDAAALVNILLSDSALQRSAACIICIK